MSGKSKFVGQPKSALDFAWMKRVGKMLDALRNGQVVTGTKGEIKYADGNTVWIIPPGGGFTEEYNPAHSYSAGQIFTIAPGRVVVLNGVTVAPGVWAINQPGTDFDGNTWVGSMPANPQLVANTVSTLPAIGANATGPYMAKQIIAYC